MQKIKQYRVMNINGVKMKQELKNKKHKSDQRQWIKTAYLNQTKNEIKSLQKVLSELIQKHQQLIKIFRISRQLFMKRSKHQTVRRHSQTERKYHRHGKSKQIVLLKTIKITKQMKQKLIIPLNKNIII